MISDAAKRVRKPIRFSSGDISGGGAFLRSDLLFEVGEMLVMEFDLPGGRHIRTQGRVVRVARGGAKDRFPGHGARVRRPFARRSRRHRAAHLSDGAASRWPRRSKS